ncbi:hypothetical protein HPP92_002553 [Vanilla planifolia]|uniref:RING-type domain-containing protein n=1 Tax=Vanilla planifolia TaxID=51239 RepID=A0A835S5J0_VANPL|nr:hypothetical protein HPP92_002553 [Vanilla planifolia]
MGSGSSKALEHDDGRRRSRWLRRFSSLCSGLPHSLSDEQVPELYRKSSETTFRGEAGNISQIENYESCEGLAALSTKHTSLINRTIDESRELPFSTQQNDPDCSTSEVYSLVEQSSDHSGCSCCPFSIVPERTLSRICKTRVRIPLESCVRYGYDDFLDNRSGFMENLAVQNNHNDRSTVRHEVGTNEYTHTTPEAQQIEAIPRSRHHGSQGPLEGSMRFSRTLSVGRLRDRVHRRNTLSEGLFGALLLEERLLSSQAVHSTGNSQLLASENSQVQGIGNHNLLEHRSAFLDRARRIRSQVRALQRMGSRFENLSINQRSCIFCGHHQTGQCMCRSSNRPPDVNNDPNSSSSISRIVMLAEALFEVLDEIQQQSAVLSSRQSFSSIGSVPAPKEIVDGIPISVYVKSKPLLNQEVPQCYICLVEYEDGDFVRTLPCQHEFHQCCIDKWLKEIHRVCPLCRGNICS